MNEAPLVSIVLTTFNYAAYLAETLSSVRAQQYKNWECIIVDDGSVDGTETLVAQITAGDDRFTYIRKENSGVSSARNEGLRKARGEFVQFLDGDDLLLPEKIPSHLEAFRKNPQADVIYSPSSFFDDGKRDVLRSSYYGNKPDGWVPQLSGKGKMFVDELIRYNFLVIHSPLVRMTAIRKTGEFDESMKALEDWDFWLRMALKGTYFHFIPVNASLVRVHTGSLSRKQELMKAGHLKVLSNAWDTGNAGFRNNIFIVLKYTELFWDRLAGGKSTRFHLLCIIGIVLLPVYLLVKLLRLLRILP